MSQTFQIEKIEDWQKVVDKYYIENAQVDPTLAITMTDNWIEFNLRYIVDYKKRRYPKHILNELIGKRFLETNGKINFASTTVEIVRIPLIDITQDTSSHDNI